MGWHVSLGAGGVCVSRTQGHGMAGATSSLHSSSWAGSFAGRLGDHKTQGKGETAGPHASLACACSVRVLGAGGCVGEAYDDGEETEP